MSRSYLTETEHIENLQYYFHELQPLLSKGSHTLDMADDLPFLVHTNDRATLALEFVNAETSKKTDRSRRDLIENSLEVFSKIFHPASLEYAQEVVQPKCELLGDHEVFTYVEYYKFYQDKEYHPYIQFVSSRSDTDTSVIGFSIQPNHFEFSSKELKKIIKIDLFKLKHFKRFQTLTNRETEMLRLLAKGFSNNEISELLRISTATVKTHRKNMLRKLDISNYRELMRYAMAFDLVVI